MDVIFRLMSVCCVAVIGCTNGSPGETGNPEPISLKIRAMTWNIERLGSVDSEQYLAAKSILSRLEPDVVALNEIEDYEASALRTLAADLGYQEPFIPVYNPFGSLRNVVLSRFPVIDATAHSSAALSGYSSANDTTRLPVEIRIDIPQMRRELVVVSQHWKAGSFTEDGFRRTVDGLRVGQVGQRWDVDTDYVLIMGDVNAEIDSMPDSPSVFNAVPNGLPSSYVLGDDLTKILSKDGFQNNPFSSLLEQKYSIIDAVQADGRSATRPSSDRRLDYIFGSAPVTANVLDTEVYDSRDEQLSDLPKTGDAPARDVSDESSDHLPVVVDFQMSEP